MTLTKYDEVMEKIELTPEAKERILKNVIDEAGSEKTVRRSDKRLRRYLALAACCVLVVCASYQASRAGLFNDLFGGSSSDMIESEDAVTEEEANSDYMKNSTSDSYDSGEGNAPQEQQNIEQKGLEALSGSMIFVSEDELSDYLGFDMNGEYFEHVCTELGMGDPQYSAYPDGVGEITYTDGVNLNYFRKAEGQKNISINTESVTEYSTAVEFDGMERSGSLEGDGPNHYLEASWTSIDGFSYSCYISEGLSQSEWFDMIDALS